MHKRTKTKNYKYFRVKKAKSKDNQSQTANQAFPTKATTQAIANQTISLFCFYFSKSFSQLLLVECS